MKFKLHWKQLTGLLFASPAIIFLLVFFLVPFCFTIYLSFCDYDLVSPPQFTGISNFAHMVKDPTLHDSIGASIYYALGVCLPIWIFAPGIAIMFNNSFRGRYLYITIFLFAAFMGVVPHCMAWKVLFHKDAGLFNKIFVYPFGFKQGIDWLRNLRLAMPALIIMSINSGLPLYSIYLIGAVAGIPKEYYEVAAIEGANFFQRLRYVILPTIKPVYLYVIIVSLVVAFQVFTQAYLLTRGGPLNATRVLTLNIYENAFFYNKFGYATAMTIILLLILIPMTFFALKLGKDRR